MADRTPVRFTFTGAPVREPVTKLGGQPVWLAGPQWPLSADSGRPMEFIGQFALSGADAEPSIGYLFMTGADDDPDFTFDFDGGENAFIVQPGGRVPGFVSVAPSAEGPSIAADALPVPLDDNGPEDPESPEYQFLGGAPEWMQGDEAPGPGWRFVAQLDSASLPFEIDFGDSGVGYLYVSTDGAEGRFFWQCC